MTAEHQVRYFEFKDDKSSKFWEISQAGNIVRVRYGKLGTNGQSQEKSFLDEAEANSHANKLVKEKIGKGYIEKSASDRIVDGAMVDMAPQESVGKSNSSRKNKKSEIIINTDSESGKQFDEYEKEASDVRFNFSNEYDDFAKSLGRLCPDKYDHLPEVGDTVSIRVDFLGTSISSGVITRILKNTKKLDEILEVLDNFEYPDEDDQEFLAENFDFTNAYDEHGPDSRGFIVKVHEKVPDSFVKKNFGALTDFSSGREMTSGRMKLNIFGTADNGYYLEGQMKGFTDGKSVISTKAMDAFKKSHADNKNVENVAWRDRAFPKTLITQLNDSLDEICQNEPADYHPGSGKVVRDIVHPSMYCYVNGLSEINASPENSIAAESISSRLDKFDRDFWGREYEDSKYQWLPSEFFVSEQGDVKIKSYINNLDREKYPGMYGLIEEMFERTLPMFEAVCNSLRNDFYGVQGDDLGRHAIPLRNRNLQVVTKIVEYRVNQEENFDGVWHVEGMSHEEILATAVCIIKRDDNFSGADIEFRRFLFQDEGDDLIMSTPQNANRPTDTMGGGDVRPLGRLKTPENRVIVFPNSHIHRLSSMYSSDGNDAVRRIVVFWLVNPNRPIVSTANVAQQQATMKLKQALENRLALMSERKLHKESYEEREVYLCEH